MSKFNYSVVVPSYNRVETLRDKTLTTLKEYKIPKEKIYIFVANEEQYEIYKNGIPSDLYGKIIIGIKGLKNVRNYIVDYFPEGKPLVCLDDDIGGLMQLNDGKLVKSKSFENIIQLAFSLCKKHGYGMWGIAPVCNAFFMKEDYSANLKFLIGHLWGCFNRKSIKLTIDYKEDYERTLMFAVKDGGVIRLNNICAKTKMGAKGGMGLEVIERLEKNKRSSLYLMRKYPGLVRLNPRREGEILLARTVE